MQAGAVCAGEAALHEGGIAEDLEMKGNRRLDALDDRLAERSPHALDRLGAVTSADDDLAEQRIIERWDRVRSHQVAVDPDSEAARRHPRRHPARARHERVRILGVDPTLDRVALEANAVLPVAQWLASAGANLLAARTG